MTRQDLLDSFPLTAPVTGGKDPMRDLPVNRRRTRPVPKADNEDETRLLWAFRQWMKKPTKSGPLETLSELMVSHEIRAYNVLAKSAKSNLPNKTN